MNRNQIIAILQAHRLTQAQAARLLGVSLNTLAVWLSSPDGNSAHRPISTPAALLLTALDAFHGMRDFLEEAAAAREADQPQ